MDNETKFKFAKSRLLGQVAPDIAEMLTLAAKLGVLLAEVQFNGSGDSGDVERPELFDATGAIDQQTWDATNHKYVPTPNWTDDHERLKSLVATYAQGLLEKSNYDWYNDEGGGGSINISLTEAKSEMNLHQYERVQVNEEYHEHNLLPDDEEEL